MIREVDASTSAAAAMRSELERGDGAERALGDAAVLSAVENAAMAQRVVEVADLDPHRGLRLVRGSFSTTAPRRESTERRSHLRLLGA